MLLRSASGSAPLDGDGQVCRLCDARYSYLYEYSNAAMTARDTSDAHTTADK